jgi:hypothetical protein
MAGDRRLLVYWDAELDGHFRRRLERALGELNVAAHDISQVDHDPDAPAPVRLALVSATAASAPNELDIVVQAGPGEFQKSAGALRLEIADIENGTRRWTAFVDQLRVKLGRASLALAPEDLEVRLDEAGRRADEAERALADMERQRNDALRTAKQAETSLVAERARAANLEQSVERLTALTEGSAFALSLIPIDLQPVASRARDHAWQARLAAARAAEAANAYPDALIWPKAQASYSGETSNRLPHGHGVILFRDGAREIATYAGAFEDGRRAGHGVATSDGGHAWSGQWADGEACGLGVLETPDGRRFEGEVAADKDGSPKQVRGWMWDGPRPGQQVPHRAVAPALPSPAGRAAGG